MAEEAVCATYSFVWEIENFALHYHASSESISSPPFIFEHFNYSKWYLKLFPQNQSGCQDYLSIYLFRDDDEKDEEVQIDYKIEAIDGNGKHLDTLNEMDKVFKGKQSRGSDKFVKREGLINEIHDWKETVLTVSCELSSKQVNRSYVSGCEARTKIGFTQHIFEREFDITKPSTWYFPPLPFYITFNVPTDDFKISVCRTEINKSYPMLAVRIALINVKGEEVVSKRDVIYGYQNNWVFPTFISKSMLLSKKDTLLHGNKFILKSEISFPKGSAISTIKNYIRRTSPTACFNSEVRAISTLLDNFRDMFVQQKYCDVKLRLGSQTIPAHKTVLAARSEVFSTMFDQDMLESKTGVVDIQEITIDTMNSLMEFMYTASVKDLDYDKALELLIAADKYQVLSLKEICCIYLKSALSESNVCDVLATADMVGYVPLKTNAMDYIKKNYVKIMSSAKWSEWIGKNSKLATEIILELSNCIYK